MMDKILRLEIRPPMPRERIEGARHRFEVEVDPEAGVVQVFIQVCGVCGTWVEISCRALPEMPE